jgi:hypothetical protein
VPITGKGCLIPWKTYCEGRLSGMESSLRPVMTVLTSIPSQVASSIIVGSIGLWLRSDQVSLRLFCTVTEGSGVHCSLHARRSPILLRIDLELRPLSLQPYKISVISANPEMESKLSRPSNRVSPNFHLWTVDTWINLVPLDKMTVTI